MQWTPFPLFSEIVASAADKPRTLARSKRLAPPRPAECPTQQLSIPFQQTLPAFSTTASSRMGVTLTRADIFQIGEFIIGRTDCHSLYGHPDIRY